MGVCLDMTSRNRFKIGGNLNCLWTKFIKMKKSFLFSSHNNDDDLVIELLTFSSQERKIKNKMLVE